MTGVQTIILSVSVSVSVSVVQTGRAFRAGEELEDGDDESSWFTGSDAAPDHPTRPDHNRPALC